MRKTKLVGAQLAAFFLILTLPFQLFSQNNKKVDDNAQRHTVTKKGYTLVIINKEPSFDPEVLQRMEDAFFEVYPAMAKRFNKKASREVTFIIEPAYDGVAYASSGRIVYNPQWFKRHPGDIDVVTHEVMHIIQGYGRTPGPFWLTEGIADYARHRYGVDNEGAGWSMPDVAENHHYTNSYRISARFLVWAEQQKNKKIVDKLDKVMRDHTYTDDIWKDITGLTLDELWAEYVKNPEIKL